MKRYCRGRYCRGAIQSIVIIWALMWCAVAIATPLKVAFFHPRSEATAGPFWSRFQRFTEDAANDLGVVLEIRYAEGNHLRMIEQVELAARDPTVSVLLFHNYKGIGRKLIEIAEREKKAAFLVNAGLVDQSAAAVPRETWRYWIGQLIPNDEQVGYDLAHILTNAALANGRADRNGKIHLLGLTGVPGDGAVVLRDAGLRRFVTEHADRVVLEQIVSANWKPELAQEKLPVLLSRYPQVAAIWSANDQMMVG